MSPAVELHRRARDAQAREHEGVHPRCRREQGGVDGRDAGGGCVVDRHVVHVDERVAALHPGGRGRRVRLDIGHAHAARRRRRSGHEFDAVAERNAGFDQRLPLLGRVGEAEPVFGQRVHGQGTEVPVDRVVETRGCFVAVRRERRVHAGHLAVPEVGLVDVGACPLLLDRQRPRPRCALRVGAIGVCRRALLRVLRRGGAAATTATNTTTAWQRHQRNVRHVPAAAAAGAKHGGCDQDAQGRATGDAEQQAREVHVDARQLREGTVSLGVSARRWF